MVICKYSTKLDNGKIVTVEGRGETELRALFEIMRKADGDALDVIRRGALENAELLLRQGA
jgi:hypothetical protein